ncbi:MAG TPA: alpha/beta hydrolase [Polyangia bacterium]|jgi:hypothetical protein
MTARALAWRALRVLALAGAGCAALLVLIIVLFENRFIFFPTKYPAGDWERARHARVPIEDVWLTASDGVRLHAWFVRGTAPEATILFFHGNAGNVADRLDWLVELAALPADVLALDYRGYGRSAGAPNEAGLYRDAEAAYRWLTVERQVPPARLVLYGKSLGGGPAAELAVRHPCRALILQSTFTSIPDMARVAMPFVPRALIRTRFDTRGKLARTTTPTLIVHSRDDELIPYAMAEQLHAAAAGPKRLVAFSGAGHNELVLMQGKQVVSAFREFLAASR